MKEKILSLLSIIFLLFAFLLSRCVNSAPDNDQLKMPDEAISDADGNQNREDDSPVSDVQTKQDIFLDADVSRRISEENPTSPSTTSTLRVIGSQLTGSNGEPV